MRLSDRLSRVIKHPFQFAVLGAVCVIALASVVQCTFPSKLDTLANRYRDLVGGQATPTAGVLAAYTSGKLYLPLAKNQVPVFMPLVRKMVPTATPTPTATSTPTPTPTYTPRPTGVPPPYSTSYYMSTTDYNALYALGSKVATQVLAGQNAIVFLDFGQPWWENNTWGTAIFGSFEHRSVNQIIDAVKAFCRGFYFTAPPNVHLTVAVGTSNYGRYTNREHGVAWAQMVKVLQDWVATPPSWASTLKIAGAIDAEPGWNPADVTRAWAEGFDSAANGNVYYNYGSCDSCPFDTCETCRPSRGWTYEDIWYVSWGVLSAYTIPEIYLVNGVNAQQWYRVSLYAWQAHGQGIRFSGVMTQYQSCQQKGCTTNTPPQGWSQLYQICDANPVTRVSLDWSTDIRW